MSQTAYMLLRAQSLARNDDPATAEAFLGEYAKEELRKIPTGTLCQLVRSAWGSDADGIHRYLHKLFYLLDSDTQVWFADMVVAQWGDEFCEEFCEPNWSEFEAELIAAYLRRTHTIDEYVALLRTCGSLLQSRVRLIVANRIAGLEDDYEL